VLGRGGGAAVGFAADSAAAAEAEGATADTEGAALAPVSWWCSAGAADGATVAGVGSAVATASVFADGVQPASAEPRGTSASKVVKMASREIMIEPFSRSRE
jgi:hypothetical protein